jgi:hypothetical protein
MNNKLRAEFVLNHLFKDTELVNQLSIYETNMRAFSWSLNKLAMPEGPEGDEDGQNNELK